MLASVLLATACTEGSTPTDVSPNLGILDAEHGDDGSHFYFLPPMVPNPGATGVFDASQPAVVRICEGETSICAQPIIEFSVDSETLTVSVEDEHYIALWHAGDFDLDLEGVYRVSVLVGAQELGHADVQPVSNGKALKDLETGYVIGLIDDRTLPIKVRIEEGAIEEGGITIDATALSALNFSIGGEGTFTTDTPVVLDLGPGTHTVVDGSGGTHEFEVTATGVVSYAAEKEPFFDGLNTSQLTLVGYEIVIDATALVASTFSLGGIGPLSTASPNTVVMLPGGKTFSSTDVTFAYEVEEDGLLDFDPSLDGILTERGTNALTVIPVP
jgi:hypothetical protein